MNPAFAEFMEDCCAALAREVPEFPTQMGLFEIAGEPVPQHGFSGIDPASLERRQALLRGIGDQLRQFSCHDLDAGQQLDAGVIRFLVDNFYERGLVGTAGEDFLHHEYPFRPAVGLQSELPMFLTDLHPMRHAADAEDYLSRLKSIAGHIHEALRQSTDRRRRGLLAPSFLLAGTVKEIAAFLASKPEDNILYRTLAEKSKRLDGLGEKARQALLSEALAELERNTLPVYRELRARLLEQQTVASAEPGVWRLPDGDAYYQFLLRCATTTALSADEIHAIGLEETSRLQKEIVSGCADLGMDAANIEGCLRALDTDRRQTLEDTDENRRRIVDRTGEMMADIESRLSGLFHRLPAGRVTVKPIPRFAEANRNHSYQPPSLDGSRAGFFELNVGQLLDRDDFDLPILVYHEIFPGHHLQIGLAQETTSLPSLRRIVTFDAYIEGWAKYAETIPEQHGINPDPRFRLARIRRELISTINLVLDTGIHAKRWSLDQATRFFAAHSGMGETFSRYIVHRSAAVPAQLCAYKLGMMKMLDLRRRMASALGRRFDVRDFHQAVLDCGAVPLDLLDSVVDREIDRLRDQAATK